MIFRRRKPRPSWYVQTHWPVGVGTVSEKLPREERYAALRSLVGDRDQPVGGEDKP